MLSSYEMSVLATMGIHILMGLSVYIPMATGQVSLGNAGFMAIGGYAAGVLTVNYGLPLIMALLVGGLVAGVVGLSFAYPALRLRGFYLVMATIGFEEIVRVFFMNFQFTGGVRGFREMQGATTGLIWFWVVVSLALSVVIFRSRIGLSFAAIDEDDVVAESLGVNLTRSKMAAFGLGGLIAGIAGGLYGHYFFFINPETFNFWISVNSVLFVILGGMQTFWGAALGAVLFTVLQEALRFAQEWRMVAFGAILVIMMIFRPSGILTRGLFRGNVNGRKPPASDKSLEKEASGVSQPVPTMEVMGPPTHPIPLLRISRLSKNFGGLRALHHVNMEVEKGMICGLIGPNGAGKTTLFNLVTGVMPVSEGEIFFQGRALTALQPHTVTGLGVVRTFQSVRLIERLTVLENVLLGQNLRVPIFKSGVLPIPTKERARLRNEAINILSFLGIQGRTEMKPSALPYGEQRRVEIARALATSPELLLLDEPAAGMNEAESEQLMVQLRRIRDAGKTILIIEHDMRVIMNLCDYIYVLNFGEKISQGRPSEIQRDQRVLEAYLGTGA